MNKIVLKSIFFSLFFTSVLFSNTLYKSEDLKIKNGITFYVASGKKVHGVLKEFYETGELASERTYKMGLLVDMKTYKILGALASSVNFKNGKAVGGKIYYENIKKDRMMINADFTRYRLEY